MEAVLSLKNRPGVGEHAPEVAVEGTTEEEDRPLPSVAELLGKLDDEEEQELGDKGCRSGTQPLGRLQWPKGVQRLAAKATYVNTSEVLQLRINGLNGPLGNVSAELSWDLAHLGHEVSQMLDIPASEQRLFLDAEELSGSGLLGEVLFGSLNAAAAAVAAGTVTELTLVRRPAEQARWRESVCLNWLRFQTAPEHIRADHEVALAAIERNCRAIEYVLGDAWNNKRLVCAAVKQDWRLLSRASEAVRGDRETVLAAVQQDGDALALASESLRGDSEIVLVAVRQNWQTLDLATDGPRNDKEVVLAAVIQDWRALEYASERLQSDESIVRVALRQDSDALELAGPELKCRREVALMAVLRNGFALEHVAPVLKADREVVLAAVRQEGCAIRHAAEELQSDREVIETAIQQNWLALKYAGAEARADLGILKAAMQKNARAYQYACEEAWNSKDFVLEAVKQTQDVSLLQYASEDLRADGGLLCAAARVDPSAIRYAAEAAWSERDFVLVAVRQKGILLQRASEELRADRMVVLEAAEQDVKAVEFASEALWSDEEFVFEAVQLQGMLIQQASAEVQASRAVVLAAVMQDGKAFQHVLKHFQEDYQMILAAAREGNVSAFKCAPPQAWADRDFVLSAVQVRACLLQQAAPELRTDPEIIAAAARAKKIMEHRAAIGLARGTPSEKAQKALLERVAEHATCRKLASG